MASQLPANVRDGGAMEKRREMLVFRRQETWVVHTRTADMGPDDADSKADRHFRPDLCGVQTLSYTLF